MMTIEQILTRFTADHDHKQAAADLQAIVEGAVQIEARRDAFAMCALVGLLANGARRPSMADLARESFQYANEMLAAKKQGA